MTRTRQRLDRKTLKKDPLLEFVSRATTYVGAHVNQVLGIAAGVVVAIVLLVYWGRGQTQRADEAELSLSQVVSAYGSNAFQVTIDLAAGVQQNFAGTSAAVLSQYLSGAAQLRLGRFAEAEQALRGYLAASAKAPLYAESAQLALASAIEGQGRHAEAAALYQETAGMLGDKLAARARFDAARAYMAAGSMQQARDILRQLADGDDPDLSGRARIQLATLDAVGGATAAPAAHP